MKNSLALASLCFASMALAAPAEGGSDWGPLSEFENWHWTTTSEPRERVSTFEWAEPGRVLVVKHGFASVLKAGGRWEDTIQRIELVRPGQFRSAYRYSDGRPTLYSDILAESDGSLTETFVTPDGSKQRNRYFFTGTRQTIAREKEHNGTWIALSSTTKIGTSPDDRQRAIQERMRQAQLALQESLAQNERDRIRLEEEFEQRALDREEMELLEAQARAKASQPNAYTILRDMADAAGVEADRAQAELRRTISRDLRTAGTSSETQSYGGSGSGSDYSGGSAIDSGRESTASVPPARPTKTGFLWCTTRGDGGVRLSSRVGTYQDDGSPGLVNNATESWLSWLRSRGLSNFGGCYGEETIAEIEAYQANVRRDDGNREWRGVDYTPSVPGQ